MKDRSKAHNPMIRNDRKEGRQQDKSPWSKFIWEFNNKLHLTTDKSECQKGERMTKVRVMNSIRSSRNSLTNWNVKGTRPSKTDQLHSASRSYKCYLLLSVSCHHLTCNIKVVKYVTPHKRDICDKTGAVIARPFM